MKNLMIILFSFILITAHGQNTCTEKVFIYDYPVKIIGQGNLEFVIIKDSTKNICGYYRLTYKDSIITKITKWIDTINHKINIVHDDCTLRMDKSNVIYYDSNGFKMHNSKNDKVYCVIDKDFLSLPNELKIERLEKILSKRKDKK